MKLLLGPLGQYFMPADLPDGHLSYFTAIGIQCQSLASLTGPYAAKLGAPVSD
jgi:hypothetical protein